MSDFLSVTERGLLQPVATRYVGATRTIMSAPFGTSQATEGAIDQMQANNCLQTDDDTLWAVLADGLYRSTDSGSTFTLVPGTSFTVSGFPQQRLAHGGIHFVYDQGNGETLLAGWYRNGSNMVGWRYRISDGAFAEVTGSVLSSADDVLSSEILYGTQIHIIYGTGTNQAQWLSWDPVAQSWAQYTPPTTGIYKACLAVGSDIALYAVVSRNNFGQEDWFLCRFTGSWAVQVNLGFVGSGSGLNAAARAALFSDGLDLHALCTYYNTAAGGGTGIRHIQITAASGFTAVNNLTSTVVPSALRTPGDGGTANTNFDKRAGIVQDTESVPGTRRTWIYWSDDSSPGTPWAVYEYLGTGTPYGFLGSGGQVRDGLPWASKNGGGYFYTVGQRGVRILAVVPVLGGERIDYLVSGGGTVTMQFRRAAQQQAATGLATLADPVGGGGTRSGNQVTGVAADGVTVHSVVWNFFADGFLNGQALSVLVPEIA